MGMVEGPVQDTFGEVYGAQFERGLLWMLLFDHRFSDAFCSHLTPELFDDDAHALVVEVLQSVAAETPSHRTPPYRVVHSEITRRSTAVKPSSSARTDLLRAKALIKRLSLDDDPPDSEKEYFQNRASAFITERNLKNALLESAMLVEKGQFEQVRTLIDEAALSGTLASSGSNGYIDFSDMKARLSSYVEFSKATHHVPMGLPTLDGHMRGGVEPATLSIIMAPTGRGKTLALIHTGAVALAHGLTVVHCTFEIKATPTQQRYDARITGIPINDIAANPIDHIESIAHLLSARAKGKLFIKEWGSDEASVPDIRAFIRTLQVRENVSPDVILVDYADLVRPWRSHRDRRFELSDTVKSLRQLGTEFNSAVITASQTNREGFRASTLSLSEIAESIEKANVADVVLGLCQDAGERTRGRMRLIILKNRLGGHEGEMVDCFVDTATQHIRENPRQARSLQTYRRSDGG